MARNRFGPRWDAGYLQDSTAYPGHRSPVNPPDPDRPPGPGYHGPRGRDLGHPDGRRRSPGPDGYDDTAGWERGGRRGYDDYDGPGWGRRGRRGYDDYEAYEGYEGPGWERRRRGGFGGYDGHDGDSAGWERRGGARRTGRRDARRWRKGVVQVLSGSVSLVLLGALLVGWALSGRGTGGPEQGAVAIPGTVSTAAPTPVPTPAPTRKAATANGLVPVRIEIPAIRVNAPVMKLDLNRDGTVQVPPVDQHNLAGWYDRGAHPGQTGSSVILGHVDSFTGVSVFFYLKTLRRGDTVKVARADGSTAVFSVDGVQVAAKSAFPTNSVYGPVKYPALHLVTCGGPFNQSDRQYLDNIIVYSHLVSVVRA